MLGFSPAVAVRGWAAVLSFSPAVAVRGWAAVLSFSPAVAMRAGVGFGVEFFASRRGACEGGCLLFWFSGRVRRRGDEMLGVR